MAARPACVARRCRQQASRLPVLLHREKKTKTRCDKWKPTRIHFWLRGFRSGVSHFWVVWWKSRTWTILKTDPREGFKTDTTVFRTIWYWNQVSNDFHIQMILDENLKDLINRICKDFQAQWKQGECQPIWAGSHPDLAKSLLYYGSQGMCAFPIPGRRWQ